MAYPTVYRARWVLPVTGPPIADGAVAVDGDGRIAAVGPAAEQDGDIVDLGEAALLPGLVNVHAHPELAAFRGTMEDLPFRDWIGMLLRTKRAAALTPDDYAAAAAWSCVEAVRAGMTTVAATEDSGAALDAFRDAGLRGVVYREVFGPAPEHAEAAMTELRRKLDAMRQDETDLVRVGVSPHAPYTVSDDLYRAVAVLVRSEGLPVATHAAESPEETAYVRGGHGPFAEALRQRGIATPARAPSTIRLLDGLGLLELRPLLIHAVQLDPEDVALIADRGCPVAHCPVANARLGHGVAPVTELLDRGVTVGLGTDSVASNNRLDLLEEARTAQLQQRTRLRSSTALPARRLLRMATLEGARALGLADRIGSLEPGKDADLCSVRLDAPHAVPVHDPEAAVLHAARGTDVCLTVVRGRVLYRDGVHHTMDLDTLRGRLDGVAGKVATAAGEG